MIGTIIRWLLVPVSAAAIVAVVIVAGRWAVSLADGRCPPDSMVGGACVEGWHTGVVETAIYAGIVLIALGFIIVPSLIAPALKRTVATLGFVLAVGAAVAVYAMTQWPVMLMPLGVAVVSGAVAVSWIWTRRPNHETR